MRCVGWPWGACCCCVDCFKILQHATHNDLQCWRAFLSSTRCEAADCQDDVVSARGQSWTAFMVELATNSFAALVSGDADVGSEAEHDPEARSPTLL
jgi:hypothetical protein